MEGARKLAVIFLVIKEIQIFATAAFSDRVAIL